ncbi:hypothetical protein A2715_00595 [Candidatus Woesebacteria bacterium RIFCSPHIGHO2_01_FULL_39_32]|uniref:Uncharacterized protein n=1 Tax=Candidatus Woesebacteria bacterium RIFCSPLOWO2_01_FULL_39_25 TaxID=1802521 RepID=A0A1F8BID0_9BACT|nr:MAG: hypothetical protein A2124_03395 [Candidatus Woesebacteria bacterium GWB1_37_5]OGM24413.1 MAG: hypothetical protein A2715_00595 [Candidatus Woesebacteria bacterium RIFCSPHIGHO2_01_FULL_39_32]OGM35579.1 MAG: hypothetical protein A3F01_02675 [Candidatus Woesebacteria bacterium RIFCSPHIGHO2_12_FULL_38_11]OGM63720.1 MAG: hypothetical protein A2893_01935 [Candidatus Woesebacteria bacterium RIFCSPLOWO2_01_FULL_39_25]
MDPNDPKDPTQPIGVPGSTPTTTDEPQGTGVPVGTTPMPEPPVSAPPDETPASPMEMPEPTGTPSETPGVGGTMPGSAGTGTPTTPTVTPGEDEEPTGGAQGGATGTL